MTASCLGIVIIRYLTHKEIQYREIKWLFPGVTSGRAWIWIWAFWLQRLCSSPSRSSEKEKDENEEKRWCHSDDTET